MSNQSPIQDKEDDKLEQHLYRAWDAGKRAEYFKNTPHAKYVDFKAWLAHYMETEIHPSQPPIESNVKPCECGCTEIYESPIVGARCKKCNKPSSLKIPIPCNR